MKNVFLIAIIVAIIAGLVEEGPITARSFVADILTGLAAILFYIGFSGLQPNLVG